MSDQGLLLTDLMGFGVNITTGDFSCGAEGFWIEGGRIAYPVTEIIRRPKKTPPSLPLMLLTERRHLSGNLKEMLASIDAVANDVLRRGSSAAASFRMVRMTVSGL